MNWKQWVRTIGDSMPSELRGLRARMLLDVFAAHMGIAEVKCSACSGRGTLPATRWERCPICKGFQEIPRPLNDWFQEEMLRVQEQGQAGGRVDGADQAGLSPLRGRLGRAAELIHHVSEADMGQAAGAASRERNGA